MMKLSWVGSIWKYVISVFGKLWLEDYKLKACLRHIMRPYLTKKDEIEA